MSDVMATVGVSKNASEGMGKAVDALFGVSNGVVGVLNSLGMTNLASSVKASAGRAHEASRSAVDQVSMSADQLVLADGIFQDIVPALRKSLAPVLTGIQASVTQLDGRQEQYWRGIGANAYKAYTDLHGKAGAELGAKVLKVATVIEKCRDSWQDVVTEFNAAILAACVGVAAAIPNLVLPNTPIAITLVAAAIGALVGAIGIAWKEIRNREKKLMELIEELSMLVANDGETVFAGHWPSSSLYSED